MKVLVVHNPLSGLQRLRNTSAVIHNYLKSQAVQFTWFETVPGETQPLEQFNFDTLDRVLVVGGDGTVRQVAQFLITHKIRKPLGIIAQGSGDVLALSLGIPTFPIERALEFALTKNPQALDAMYINKTHYALVAAGQGYDTHFIKHATRRLKRALGIFAYGISFLKTFFGYNSNSYKLLIDGRKYYASGKSVMVFNIFSIVGLPIDSTISPHDGVLNMLILNPYSLWDVIRMAGLTLLRYPMTKIPKIQAFTGTHISIKAKHEKRIQIDGEVLHGHNLLIEVIPNALEVVYEKNFP